MKKVIIVPSWIKKVLAREHCAITDVLSFDKMRALLAPEDIRTLLLIQSYGPFGAYHVGPSDATALLSAWRHGVNADYISEFESLVTAGANSKIDKDRLQFLIKGDVEVDDHLSAFEIIPADHYTMLLVLQNGYFSSKDYDLQDINIVENILRVLYGEFVPEDVARTAIFQRYVNVLGKQYI